MSAVSTPNTRVDAAVRIVEDVVVVAGSALATWSVTHSADDVLTAVAAAPVARSAIASVLSSGRVSGLVLAVKIIRRALRFLDEATAAPAPTAAPPALEQQPISTETAGA